MFSLNSLNSVTKVFVIAVILPTSHLLCKRPGCYHSTSILKVEALKTMEALNPEPQILGRNNQLTANWTAC